MNSSRKGWTDYEEKLLFDTVHSYSEQGLSKKAAFKEVSAKINRSTATCSHHYYAIRKRRETASNDAPLTLEDCIHFLLSMQEPGTVSEEKKRLQKEKDELLQVQKELKGRFDRLLKKQEKLRQLLSILKEAENFAEAPSGPVIH
ncbi:hypothetical protein AAEO50_16885 [Rossellomorea oryzaecorticis]|uniref:Myb-like domain-containing protein n=1 Tax=Rossellomorea oryzaecorticis TaxID=1396505 RepID=A0ABU9KCW3_9BACI